MRGTRSQRDLLPPPPTLSWSVCNLLPLCLDQCVNSYHPVLVRCHLLPLCRGKCANSYHTVMVSVPTPTTLFLSVCQLLPLCPGQCANSYHSVLVSVPTPTTLSWSGAISYHFVLVSEANNKPFPYEFDQPAVSCLQQFCLMLLLGHKAQMFDRFAQYLNNSEESIEHS